MRLDLRAVIGQSSAAVLFVLGAAACSASDASVPGGQISCVPREIVSCACANGTTGFQTCGPDGTFGACVQCGSDAPADPGTAFGSGGSATPGVSSPSGGSTGALEPGAGTAGDATAIPGAGGTSGVATGGAGGVATGGASGTAGSGGTGGEPEPPAPPPERGDLAAEIDITRVSVYQGVDVPIMRDRFEVAPFERNAPVVAERPALVRVFATPRAGWQPREVAGRLEITHPASPGPLEDVKFISQASFDDDLGSTFNFDVPGGLMTPESQYSVSVLETSAASAAGGAADGARWPAQGTLPFGPFTSNGPFRLMIVPIIQNGFLPDTSPGRIDEYRDDLFALFPVPEVEIQVHDPVTPPVTVQQSGGGWAEVLNFVEQLRLSEPTDSRVYYYGALAPAQSFASYCQFGCVAGLANATFSTSNFGRSSVGLGFFPDGSGSATMVAAHEVGHSLGRPHAPCQAPDAPPGYPHPGGGIGVWGYDLTRSELKSPAVFKDVMGYCEPRWISDYTFLSLFDRISVVNANGLFVSPSESAGSGRYRVAIVGQNGSLKWGLPVDVPSSPIGTPVEIRVLDERQQTVGSVDGHWVPFEGLEGGFLLASERDLEAHPAAARLEPVGLGTRGTLPLD